MLLLMRIALLATCCSSTYAASVLGRSDEGGHKLISAANAEQPAAQNATTAALDLPRGFKPQPPPVNPLLYPFATAAPAWAAASTTVGWTPIVGDNVPLQRNNFSELLQDRSSNVDDTQLMEEGPVLESIVYGTWKPDHPVQPHKMLSAPQSELPHSAADSQPTGQQVERLDQPNPIVESGNYVGHTERILTPNYGRHKISSREHSLEVITVNTSDPKLLDAAKQINDSIESVRPSGLKSFSTTAVPTRPTASLPLSEQQPFDSHKIWPTDFIASDEQTISTTIHKSKYNFIGDSSDQPQALSNLNVPDNLLPEGPFNITKVGVPYEDLNSAEEPSICVPLMVREQINGAEVTDMERVYCFPLPSPEVAAANRNHSEVVEHSFGDNATASSTNTSLHNPSTIVVLSLLFILKIQLT